MQKHLEIEFKQLLSKEEYLTILHDFKKCETKGYHQINYYLETKNHTLHQHHYALRIRYKDQRYELTLKRPYKQGRMEYNAYITHEQFINIKDHGDLKHPILQSIKDEGIDLSTLYCPCFLETSRIDIPYLGGLLSLDHNHYLNQEDYEIEYEHDDFKQGQAHFIALLEKYNIAPSPSTPSKTQRAFQAYQNH